MDLEEKLKDGTAEIAVIGLGYVGMPLAVEVARSGLRTHGIDVNQKIIDQINKGLNHIKDVDTKVVEQLVNNGSFSATTDFSICEHTDVISICVPTPLNEYNEPDLSYILKAGESIAPYLRKGHLVLLESTTYPGTTEEMLLPILAKSGLLVDKDFFLAFSPERVDPGNEKFSTKNTPKVVGGVSADSTKKAAAFYSRFIDNVIPVSTSKVAEMTKLLENIFRCVNIALVNELALLCDRMDIDVWEVVEAASTKPFGFMAFKPGPGLGGHCIPIDPFYLSWKAREYGFNTEFIELAGKTNRMMPRHVISKVADALNKDQKSINGSSILLLGIAYKKNVEDLRESPALEIAEMLVGKGAVLSYHDPHVAEFELDGDIVKSVELNAAVLSKADLVVIVTDHTDVDYGLIAEKAARILDTRNIMCKYKSEKIERL